MADLATKAINTYGLNDETLGLGHKVLIVGDSAEYLTLVSDIAKKIVEDYAGSTLAGSAQSIASAFTQVPLLAGVNTVLTSDTDLNTVTTVGTYNASNAVAGSLLNGPEGVTLKAFRMTVERALGIGSEWYRQTIILGASVYSGYRRYTAGGVTWSAWEKIPERADIESAYSLSEGPRPDADTDWNTLTDPGTFFFNAVPTGDNKPIADKGKLIVERRLYNVRDVRQTFYPSTQSNGLFFVRTGSTNGTWEAWEKVPTRAEIDAVATNIGTFSSVTIPIAASTSAEDLAYTSDTLNNGVYLLILSRLNNASVEYDYVGFLTVHNTSHVSDIFKGSSAPDDIAVTNKILTFTRKNNNVSGRLIRL